MAELIKLKDLAVMSDDFTDEMLLESQYKSYANEALSIINTEVGLQLPFVKDVNEDYEALPPSWFVRLLNVFMSYGIKMNDGSLNEADRYYERFWIALGEFKEVALDILDDEYVDWDAQSKHLSRIDVNPNIRGWF